MQIRILKRRQEVDARRAAQLYARSPLASAKNVRGSTGYNTVVGSLVAELAQLERSSGSKIIQHEQLAMALNLGLELGRMGCEIELSE